MCERREGEGEFGASQTLTLNRTNIAPFIIRGWSKAENVSGSPDSGYSLYVDITYADGTPLWGQTADFNCGTHDWEQRQFVLLPDKPVKSFTLHCLFRGHTGKAWFDDASVEEVPTPAGAVLFQGAPLQGVTQAKPDTKAAPRKLSTRDGAEADAARQHHHLAAGRRERSWAPHPLPASWLVISRRIRTSMRSPAAPARNSA